MWLKAVLVVAVLVTTVVIAVRQVPLGVPGEWTWSRQALAADITEAMDRLLIPLIVSAALVVFCRFIDRQIAHASTRRQVVFVGLLVVVAMCTEILDVLLTVNDALKRDGKPTIDGSVRIP